MSGHKEPIRLRRGGGFHVDRDDKGTRVLAQAPMPDGRAFYLWLDKDEVERLIEDLRDE